MDKHDNFVVLKKYVNPGVFALIMAFGLVGNGTLLLIFVRHKEMRTRANTMIINLAVSDLLSLGISAPLFCIFHYPHSAVMADVTLCRLYTAGRHFFLSASALSVLALSVQRLCITTSSLQYSRRSCWTHSTSPALYVFAVWLLSFLVALPMFLVRDVYGYLCSSYTDEFPTRVLFLMYALMFCLLLPALILFSSMLTARRLRQSAGAIPCAMRHTTHERVRRRSASVVTCLAIVFVLTYFPHRLWSVVVYWTDPDRQSAPVMISEYVTKYMLFANGCFNPIALCVASGTFRRLFMRYLCCSLDFQQNRHSDKDTSTFNDFERA